MTAALSAVPVPIVAVNANRQIVYANEAMVGFVGAEAAESLIGLRPGEAHIVRPADEPPEALDVQVSSRTFQVGDDAFTMLTITDIGDQKRRHALERIFFHDVLNTVQKTRAAVDLLDEVGDDAMGPAWGTIRKAVLRLTEEIQAQRDLATMERDELTLMPTKVDSRSFLEDLAESYLDRDQAQGGRLVLDPESVSVTRARSSAPAIRSGPVTLLSRRVRREETFGVFSSGLKAQGALAQAHVPILADYEVIENIHLKQFACIDKPPG